MKRITLLILLLLIAGCSTFSSSRIQPTPTLSTKLPEATVTISPTSPSKPTPTIMIPTPSPLPTLPPAEAEAMTLNLLQDNGGCLFPCWWGLTPGKTSTQTAKSLLEKFTANSLRTTFYEDVGGASWLIEKNGLLLDIIVSFTYDRLLSGTVESFRITTEVKKELEGGGFETVWENPLNEQFLQAYALPQILSTYGQPKDVLVFANEGWRYFSLILNYSEQGFVVWYSAPLESSGDKYLGCMSKAFTKLYLWAPEFSYTWAEGVTGTGDKSEIDSLNRDFQPLEKVTSMTLDEFYNDFVDTNNFTCLETPKQLWPGP
ncbi:MAG: hypothetical protein L0287_29990 [Anaerolineae bacterium]|nr:hypothetical protein [Anaerolineae bacterium]